MKKVKRCDLYFSYSKKALIVLTADFFISSEWSEHKKLGITFSCTTYRTEYLSIYVASCDQLAMKRQYIVSFIFNKPIIEAQKTIKKPVN